MTKELSYLTPEGHTVFTSTFLKNRGSCCRSACLHCPYGFTLKKYRLQFKEISPDDKSEIEMILEKCQQSHFNWQEYPLDQVRLIYLKNNLCGVIFMNKLQIKHHFLLPHFQHQGLNRELIESYYFI
jgi:hypothetical protein